MVCTIKKPSFSTRLANDLEVNNSITLQNKHSRIAALRSLTLFDSAFCHRQAFLDRCKRNGDIAVLENILNFLRRLLKISFVVLLSTYLAGCYVVPLNGWGYGHGHGGHHGGGYRR